MEQSRRGVLMTLILLASGTLALDIPAYGDTYTYQIVANTQSENFYGIDNVGDFVFNISDRYINPGSVCAGVMNPSSCYDTYYVGTGKTVISVNPPNLNYDDGSPCTPSISGFDVLGGACNNGHEIFGGYYLLGTPQAQRGVWTGPDPVKDFLENGSFDGGFINHLGDAVFIDGANDTLVWAEDLGISPEPGSFVLFGTGGLMVVTLLIRKPVEKGKQLRREQCLS